MELTKYPKFSQLVPLINKKIEERCSLIDIEAKWTLSKREMVKHKLVFNETKNILLEIESKIAKMEASKKEIDSYKTVKKIILNSQYLEVSPDTVEHTKLQTGNLNLFTLLNEKFKLMSIQLLEYHDFPKEYSENDKICQARSIQLGDIVETEKNELNECTEKLKSIKNENISTIKLYFNELEDCAKIILKLIKKYSIYLLPVKDKILARKSLAKLEATHAKLQSLIANLKRKTYSNDKVESLSKISSALSEKQECLEQEMINIEHQLASFQKLGKEFEEIAAEYREVKTSIEKQNWTIQKIQNNT